MTYVDRSSLQAAEMLVAELKAEGFNTWLVVFGADSYQVRYWK